MRPRLVACLLCLWPAVFACGSEEALSAAEPAAQTAGTVTAPTDAPTVETSADAGTPSQAPEFRAVVKEPEVHLFDAADAWVATFTHGTRTVRLAGPERSFMEPTAAAPVVSRHWVRLLPAPFTGDVDENWVRAQQGRTEPDVLATAMQYVSEAPTVLDDAGFQYAGDASYGARNPDGTQRVGSDFNDYLGVVWPYATEPWDSPEADELGSLDCSGFVRMVFGYRLGLPLGLRATTEGGSLPRRSDEQLASAPGLRLVADTGVRPADLSLLAAGDLVFFDADAADGTTIDHVGIFVGVDAGGRRRFISSRKSANGPTLGDTRGPSVLDGDGLYARSLRGVRRL